MAIVKEFIARNGVHVRIADDCYAHLTPEEMEQRRAEINNRIVEIVIADQLKQARKAAQMGNTEAKL